MAPSAAVAADAAAEEGAAPARAASSTGRLSGFAKAMLALLAGAILVLDFLFIPFHAADDEEHFPLAYAAAHFHLGPVPSPDPRTSSGTY
ncbi:MAG TPA: hypothetical protein VFP14_13030, partial [Novosphingobium sp.]|nr:hypothetical protein [Novosphingobium sp.]